MAIVRPRGVNDFLPADTAKWRVVETLLHQMCAEYGFGEIRTPIFEETELFARGVGENTDIVQKEMYTFTDLGGRSMTLRPEFTASLCRAYIENKLYGQPQPQKLYCMGPLFRYERPQAGRFRQFHQFNIEIIGTVSPLADAEIITFVWDLYHRLAINGLILRLNSVGCPECRAVYRAALQDYLRPNLSGLCPTCQDRFTRNPMRILDCKNEVCRGISAASPRITGYLCAECAEHFAMVKQYLDFCGIPYSLDSSMVRGLDYYTKTVFEICVEGIGAQSALCGGGRYDGLIAMIGGPPTPAVGVALGMERIFVALAAQDDEINAGQGIDVFVVTDFAAAAAVQQAFALTGELRQSGMRTAMDYENKSFKAQFKTANRLQASHTVIVGGEEAAKGVAQVKNMASGEQVELPTAQVRQYLQSEK